MIVEYSSIFEVVKIIQILHFIQRITMCTHGYHHNGFMETPALGTQEVRYDITFYVFFVSVI